MEVLAEVLPEVLADVAADIAADVLEELEVLLVAVRCWDSLES